LKIAFLTQSLQWIVPIGKLTRVQDVRSAGKKVVQSVIYAVCHLCSSQINTNSAFCHLCSLSFMQPVIYAFCHLCSLSFMQYVISAVKMKHRQNNCLVILKSCTNAIGDCLSFELIKKHLNTTMSFLSILPLLLITSILPLLLT